MYKCVWHLDNTRNKNVLKINYKFPQFCYGKDIIVSVLFNLTGFSFHYLFQLFQITNYAYIDESAWNSILILIWEDI